MSTLVAKDYGGVLSIESRFGTVYYTPSNQSISLPYITLTGAELYEYECFLAEVREYINVKLRGN